MMEGFVLYEKFILIERNESQINGAWKGAHLLLFFLAFVFGSFCTFCFHMLMYLFEEKCVLYPKLLSLIKLRQNIIYELMPYDLDEVDMLPVDFLSTQWVEKSVCYLPTYVPLVSGIFGLVWTTMFLMCLTGSRILTGLQKSWRILPAVFIFSIAMGSLCIYTSTITTQGLQELCLKLGEITGSPTCSFTINVATLVYERRIRGVYQAVKLTMVTAWLHTFCWIMSALLTVVRVILAVDFQLVRVSARLKGNINRLLEEQENHIATVFPTNTMDNASINSLGVKWERKFITKDVKRKSDSVNDSESQPSDLGAKEQHNFIVELLNNIANNAVTLSEYPKGNPERPKEVDFKDELTDGTIKVEKREKPAEEPMHYKPTTSKEKGSNQIESNLKENTSQTQDKDNKMEASASQKPEKKKKKVNKATQTYNEEQD